MRDAESQAQFEQDEKLRAAQVPYDPATMNHGVVPEVVPGSVAEMYKAHMGLKARVADLEDRSEVLASGAYNMLLSRIEQLEKNLASMGQKVVDTVEGLNRLHGMGIDAPADVPAAPADDIQQQAAPQVPPSPFRSKKS